MELEELVQRVGQALVLSRCFLITAESCTGGGVGQALTAVAGSSRWYDRGFITYSDRAKVEVLGVSPTTLALSGAVSEPIALEMARGALAGCEGSRLALAVTGIAGPDGGTQAKPVGTVCFAWVRYDGCERVVSRHFCGDRAFVRQQAVVVALRGVLEILPARDDG